MIMIARRYGGNKILLELSVVVDEALASWGGHGGRGRKGGKNDEGGGSWGCAESYFNGVEQDRTMVGVRIHPSEMAKITIDFAVRKSKVCI